MTGDNALKLCRELEELIAESEITCDLTTGKNLAEVSKFIMNTQAYLEEEEIDDFFRENLLKARDYVYRLHGLDCRGVSEDAPYYEYLEEDED